MPSIKFYCMKIFHLIVVLLVTNLLLSQSNFDLKVSRGILFIDKFGQSSNSIIGVNSKASLTEVGFSRQILNIKYFDLNIESGLSAIRYYYFVNGSSAPRSWAFYLPMKIGIEYPLGHQRINGTLMLSNYLNINPKSDRYLYKPNDLRSALLVERRIFMNLDLGLSAKLGKRTSLCISTPISLLPIVASAKGVTHTDLSTPGASPYKVRAEIWGATLGIKWTLGKVEDRPKRSKEKVRIDRY